MLSKAKRKEKATPQLNTINSVRKTLPQAPRAHKNKKAYSRQKGFKNFSDLYEAFMAANGKQKVVDTTYEASYADGQDSTVPSSQPLVDATDTAEAKPSKAELIEDIIADLQDLAQNHDWSQPIGHGILKAMADTLRDVGIEPTDIDASIGRNGTQQKQYLITGPSSWEGGLGTLKDLQALLKHATKHPFYEDESVTSSDLPAGDSNTSIGISESFYSIGTVNIDNPYGTGRKFFNGIDKIEASTDSLALMKFVHMLAKRERIKISPKILYNNALKNGVKIKKLPDPEAAPAEVYWWNKD